MHAVKQFAKDVLSRNLFLPLVKGRRYIFLFHDVSDLEAPQHNTDVSLGLWPYSYTTSDFVALLDLYERLFELISLDDIVAERPAGKKRNFASISFDDGFFSVLDVAFPILKARGIPFSIFINKDAAQRNRLPASTRVLLRKAAANHSEELARGLYARCEGQALPPYQEFIKNPFRYVDEAQVMGDEAFLGSLSFMNGKIYLDENDIRRLFQVGVVIGSHTVTHPKLIDCDESTLTHEIYDNKTYLTALLRSEVHHFAIPFGGKSTFTEQAVAICRQAGHRYIYSTNPTSFRYQDIQQNQVPIPRYCIYKPDPKEFMFYINRPFLLPSNQ